jgi:hypothetical protein
VALTLNGSSEYLENDGVAAITAVGCSLRAKWRPATVATQSSLLGFYSSSATNPIIRTGRTSAGKVQAVFRADDGTSSTGTGTTTLSTSVPQIIGANIAADGAASALYNGTVEHTGAAPASTTITLNRTLVGRRHASTTSDNFSDGDIYWVAAWNRVLTAAEDAMLVAGLSPLFIPRGLVYYDEPIVRENWPGVGPVVTRTGGTFITHGKLIYPGHGNENFKSSAAGEANTGTGSVAVDGIAASATGLQRDRGVAAVAVDGVAASAGGLQRLRGAASIGVDGIAATAAGRTRDQGAASAAVDGIALASVGRQRTIGVATAVIDGVAASGAGLERVRGLGSVAIDGIAASGSEAAIHVGSGSVAVDGIGAAAAGVLRVLGSAQPVIDGIQATSVGLVRVRGQGAAVAAGAVVAALGRLRCLGAGSVAVDGIGAAGSEVQEAVYGRGTYAGTQARRGSMTGAQGRFGFYDGGAA